MLFKTTQISELESSVRKGKQSYDFLYTDPKSKKKIGGINNDKLFIIV